MILPNQPIDPFTPAAGRRWAKISPQMQERILANVWCGNCGRAVRINLKIAEVKGKDLVLTGTCKACGMDVCRVVEPEGG